VIVHRLQRLASRLLGLGEPGVLRAQVAETHARVLEINHNLLDIQRRFDEVSGDVELLSALTLSLERTGLEIARLSGARGSTPTEANMGHDAPLS
jgi:hypothetical protein